MNIAWYDSDQSKELTFLFEFIPVFFDFLLKWLLFKGKPTEELQISDTIHSG